MIIILKDSILKCINNDSDIYFLSQKLTSKIIEYSKKKILIILLIFILKIIIELNLGNILWNYVYIVI
jgi:glucose-6-phosphate-specific signal transduction histidine kinase